MKIKIFTDISFLGVGFGFSKPDLAFISVLEDDPKFWYMISKFRKDFKINLQGFDLDDPSFRQSLIEYSEYPNKDIDWWTFIDNHMSLALSNEEREQLCIAPSYLMDIYGLHDRWYLSIMFFIFFNQMPSFDSYSLMRIISGTELVDLLRSNEDGKLNDLRINKNAVYIEINGKLSKKKLLEDIENEYNFINSKISDKDYYPRQSKVNIKLHKRIYHLRSFENKKFREIADIVNDEFSCCLSEDDVKNKFDYYTKKVLDNPWKALNKKGHN